MFSPLSGILRRFSRIFSRIAEDIAGKILSVLHEDSDIKAIVERIWQAQSVEEAIGEAVRQSVRESYEKGTGRTIKLFPSRLDEAWDESGMKLSEKLHGADAEMRAAIVKTIREQLKQNQHALKATRALYDGYGSGQAVIRRQHIPKYLQEVVYFARRSDLTKADQAELLKKVRRARRQVERLGQGGAPNKALKTAYSELLDAVTDGTEKALTRSVHTAIEEKSRYVAERIARTEAARAWADGFVEKYMNDDTVVAFQWKLSSRHPVFDICNLYAEADLYGLGKGIYPKDATPRLPVHPHCLCHLAPVYRSELNKTAHNLVKSGGEKYINALSFERRQKLLGVAGSKRYAAGQDWRTLARNYSPEVMKTITLRERRAKALVDTGVVKDITKEYIHVGMRKEGLLTVPWQSSYAKSDHREEIRIGQLLYKKLGGELQLLAEANQQHIKTPDYMWNGKYWDLKNISSINAANNAIRKGLKQISENPGGLILWIDSADIDMQQLFIEIVNRLYRSAAFTTTIIIGQHSEIAKVLRYTKK